MIAEGAPVSGRVKSGGIWATVTDLSISYDHPIELDAEHAVSIDLVGPDSGVRGRVALELELSDARRLLDRLQCVIQAADAYEQQVSGTKAGPFL